MTRVPDYVWGASAIASLLNVSTRQAYYMLEQGLIPARKVGAKWVVSRQQLDQFLQADEAA